MQSASLSSPVGTKSRPFRGPSVRFSTKRSSSQGAESSTNPRSCHIIDSVNGAGAVHIAGPGAGPQDGFTEYPAFGAPVRPRWGDYSAAVADADGSIWLAAEYIPNAPRDIFANWGSFVMHVTP